MMLAIDTIDRNGLSNKAHCEHMPKKTKIATAMLAIHFMVDRVGYAMYVDKRSV